MRYSLRILFKYKLYTVISLLGLGVAFASCWFITDFARIARQYDTFHQHHDRIYRITMEVNAGGNTDHYATTGKPLGHLLHENYPVIEAYAKLSFHNAVVQINTDVYEENGFFSVNPEVLKVFLFDFVAGDKKTCFSQPNSIVLSGL